LHFSVACAVNGGEIARKRVWEPFMANLNNPADRLYAVLYRGKAAGDQFRVKPSVECWSILLKAPANNQALMIKRLGEIMELPYVIQEQIGNLSGVNHSLYMRWMPKVQDAFRANHLAGAFNTFIDKIDAEALLGIEHCGELLSQREPEPVFKTEQVISLEKQVKELIDETRKADIDSEIKKFILKHLFAIRNAIEEYEIFGSKPLASAFGQALTSVIAEPQESIKVANSDEGKKFWGVIGNLSKLLVVADKGALLAGEVLKLIGFNQ
jgi:hypothetical protein